MLSFKQIKNINDHFSSYLLQTYFPRSNPPVQIFGLFVSLFVLSKSASLRCAHPHGSYNMALDLEQRPFPSPQNPWVISKYNTTVDLKGCAQWCYGGMYWRGWTYKTRRWIRSTSTTPAITINSWTTSPILLTTPIITPMTPTKKGAAINHIWKRLNGSIPDNDKATIVAQLMKALEGEGLQKVDMRKKSARTAVDSAVKKVIPSMPSTLRAVYDRKQKAVVTALSQLFVQHRLKGPESGKRIRRRKSMARRWSRTSSKSSAPTRSGRRGRPALIVPDDDDDDDRDATVAGDAETAAQALEPGNPPVTETQPSSASSEGQEQVEDQEGAEDVAENEEGAQEQGATRAPVGETSQTAKTIRTPPFKSINTIFNSMLPLPIREKIGKQC